MTLTFELDLNNIEVNQQIKYLGQRLFSWNVIVQTHKTHTKLTVVTGPLKWLIKMIHTL